MYNKRIGKYWDESWNPVKDARGGYHCTKCSPGCANCWAEKINMMAGGKPYNESQRIAGDDTPVEFVISEKAMNGKITQPKPQTFFVCDLCDLFHKDVPADIVGRVIRKIETLNQHTYLLLTKRPQNALRYFDGTHPLFTDYPGPSEHIWLGVSVCVKEELPKIDILRNTPAAHRWVSFGPLLENMGQVNLDGIDWVVIEEESLGYKPGRPSSPSGQGWHTCVLPIVKQCKSAQYEKPAPPCFQPKTEQGGQTEIRGIPVWVKQIHYQNRLVKNIEELPVDIRFRERPPQVCSANLAAGAPASGLSPSDEPAGGSEK
jgi:protein gp37